MTALNELLQRNDRYSRGDRSEMGGGASKKAVQTTPRSSPDVNATAVEGSAEGTSAPEAGSSNKASSSTGPPPSLPGARPNFVCGAEVWTRVKAVQASDLNRGPSPPLSPGLCVSLANVPNKPKLNGTGAKLIEKAPGETDTWLVQPEAHRVKPIYAPAEWRAVPASRARPRMPPQPTSAHRSRKRPAAWPTSALH